VILLSFGGVGALVLVSDLGRLPLGQPLVLRGLCPAGRKPEKDEPGVAMV